MDTSTSEGGLNLSPEEISQIRDLIRANPGWSRRRLSRELAAAWQWRNPAGELRDMAVRNLLTKLDARGLIVLPASRPGPPRGRPLERNAHRYNGPPIESALKKLQPLELSMVQNRVETALVRAFFASYHYLGESGPAGAKIAYLARDNRQRPLACLLFASAAWKVACRDEDIGWSARQRKQNLHLLANNTRFLILPWVRVPNLASWILGQCLRRLSSDWENKYGHPIHLVETFVESERFTGACYRAANFMAVGRTRGRSRNDRRHALSVPVKEVYLYPTIDDYRHRLRQEREPSPPGLSAVARPEQLPLCLETHSMNSSSNGAPPSSRSAPASGPSSWP